MNKNILQTDQENRIKFKDEVAPILDKLLALNLDLLVGAIKDYSQLNSYISNLIIKLKNIAFRTEREILSIEMPEYLCFSFRMYSHSNAINEIDSILGIPLKTSIDHYQITIELPCREKLTRTCTPENNYKGIYHYQYD